MSSNILNEDVRSIKTKKALYDAMFLLLKKFSFRKITIKEICEEALISRAAFYAHFIDKYDLLKHWLNEVWPKYFNLNDTYEKMEKAVNYQIQANMIILENLLCDADNETFGILFDFLLSTINLNIAQDDDSEVFIKNVVLANFYAGGIISYLLWQVKNNFPVDVPSINKHLYSIICEFQNWKAK